VYEAGVQENGTPLPLKAMGRFSHEALAIDPTSGIVYMTEDGPSFSTDAGSGFYRFIPRNSRQLRLGGRLQMLKVVGQPQYDTRPLAANGTTLSVEWVDIPKPDPNMGAGDKSTFQQGYDVGGASFRRLEGCWYGDRKIFFLSTDGGPVTASGGGEGQVFVYNPATETVQLIFASPDPLVLENPDNLGIAPNGSLILCEDNSGSTANPGERLLFLNLNGEIFNFALNNMNFTATGLGQYLRQESGILFTSDYRQSEWAGATFSADGKWLFVNIQSPGVTFAITGPWVWRQ
jgi:secreted PhoX family phosphatase